MTDFTSPLFNSLVKLTLFSLSLSLGCKVSFRQVIRLWQRPGLLNRAIWGMSVIEPLVAILIGLGMSLPAEVKMGLILVSISPGTSLPLQHLFRMAQRHLCIEALQATVAFLSVITVPLTVAVMNELLPDNVRIAPFAVAQQLLVFQSLPLLLGIGLHHYYPTLMEKLAKILFASATLLLCILMLWKLSQQFHTMLYFGVRPILAIALLALVSLWLGHWLGGKEITTRKILALTFLSHNVALALFIAIINLPHVPVSPAIAVYLLMSLGLAIAYFKWNHR